MGPIRFRSIVHNGNKLGLNKKIVLILTLLKCIFTVPGKNNGGEYHLILRWVRFEECLDSTRIFM
jgi:hypothetical protein